MKYWFHGDTIIEDLTYKKVYVQYDDSIADFNNARYFAVIREDTAAGKVYCTNPYYQTNPYNPLNNEREILLCDFSVNVGDTVSFYSLWEWDEKKQVVKSIDSILIDNQYRKRVNFVHERWGNSHIESWIEGIGSTHGLFYPGDFNVADGRGKTILLCAHIDERLIYHADYYYNCYIPNYTSIDEHKKEIVKIYPTIVNDILYIETDKDIEDFSYEIINIQRQMISNGLCTSNVIHVSNLAKGLYYILISDNKNTKNIKIQKFVKH